MNAAELKDKWDMILQHKRDIQGLQLEIHILLGQNKILMECLQIYEDKNSWLESINADGNLTGDFDLLNISKHGYEPAAEAIKKVKGEVK